MGSEYLPDYWSTEEGIKHARMCALMITEFSVLKPLCLLLLELVSDEEMPFPAQQETNNAL